VPFSDEMLKTGLINFHLPIATLGKSKLTAVKDLEHKSKIFGNSYGKRMVRRSFVTLEPRS
jgi:hypothetical protein